MAMSTADLSDQNPEGMQVAEPIMRDFGGRSAFCGPLRTVKLHEDNSLVREALQQPGEGAVLVVDGGGSLRCALLGDMLGRLAVENGWAGVVVNGCVRDTAVLATLDLGIRALAANPLKSLKRGEGQRDIPVRFAGVLFTPGHKLVADQDGILVLPGS